MSQIICSNNKWIRCSINRCFNRPSKILRWGTELLSSLQGNCKLRLTRRLLLWLSARMRNRRASSRRSSRRTWSKSQVCWRVRWSSRGRSGNRSNRERDQQQVDTQLQINIWQPPRFHNIQDSQMQHSLKLRLANINHQLQELEVLMLILCNTFRKMRFKYSNNRYNNSSLCRKSTCSKQWFAQIALTRSSTQPC